MTSTAYRALVCITTCRRFGNLLRYLPHYAAFCRDDSRFHLLISLDGTEDPYLRFCEEWRIPLVYSDRREGVGLSKNRVLERYSEYDYYFFIEDDVELMDGRAFPLHPELHEASGIHHFSLFERGGVRGVTGASEIAGHRVVHGRYGGAPFNFFTRQGLERVGGWHPIFAEYKRWGHTEHSHRFPLADLAPAAFNVAEDLSDCFMWHVPPAVTRVEGIPADEDQIALPERELMAECLPFVPLQTLSPHHSNGVSMELGSERLAGVLDAGDRYPLVRGAERRRCWSDYHLWRFKTGGDAWGRIGSLVSALQSPGNPSLRHLARKGLGLG